MKNILNGHLSDLRFAKAKTKKDLTENKRRRMSALFRDIRKMDSVMGIGDWSIMSMIVQEVSKLRKLSHDEIKNMCRNSEEYKDMQKRDKMKFIKGLWESIDY